MKVLGEIRSKEMVGRVRNRAQVQAIESGEGERDEGLDEKPRSVYEVVTRQMLMELKEDVGEVKGRVNTLLWVVLGAIVVEFVMRVVR